ncbi:uroporphyrinogen-III synthase [Sphingomonas sp. CJ20]
MSRAIAVLRPEPGNAATAAAIEAQGGRALRVPLFAVQPVAWNVPAGAFDALILTSANAVRHGGPGLVALRALPVHAVGSATAAAARAAGFDVVAVGSADAAALLAEAARAGVGHALHLGGRERTVEAGGIVAAAVTVYASEPIDADVSPLAGAVALVQSARAGARLAALVDAAGLARDRIALAAISPRAAAAAGAGWEQVRVAADLRGATLIDTAIALGRRAAD